MPWAMMVDSRATTGALRRKAADTSGWTWKSGGGAIMVRGV